MNILVIGCGRVGSNLANMLSRVGHDVSIIDSNEENFLKLADDFNGINVTGVPIDQDVLKKAGIEVCDALAAVTQDDNMNILVCQIAKQMFKVDKILARVYDPSREDIFTDLGIRTFCPTNLTVESAVSIITDRDQIKYVTFDSTTVAFTTIKVPKNIHGKNISAITPALGEKLIGVIHTDGKMVLLDNSEDLVVYGTDRLVMAKTVSHSTYNGGI